MAYDIYGNYLKLGHCEVHPNIKEPYPCSQCELEREEDRRIGIEDGYYSEMEQDYYRYLQDEYEYWLEQRFSLGLC